MRFSGSAPENKPQAAPAAAAPVAAAPAANNNEIIAVIAAAIAACAGGEQIASIKRLGSSASWTNYGRIEAVTVRDPMF